MWLDQYEEVYIYNLKEVADMELEGTSYEWNDIFEAFRAVSEEYEADASIETLWSRYIFPRIYGSYFIPGNKDVYDREFMERWVEKAQALLLSSSTKYKPMIAAFDSLSPKLGDQIHGTTTTKTWFNDTPQDTTATQGEDLSHTSTYSKNEVDTKSDIGTAANRLAEINSSVASYYQLWANEFIIGMGVDHDEQ